MVGREDEVLVGKVTDVKPALGGKRMTAWHSENKRGRFEIASLKSRVKHLGVGANEVECS